MTKRIEWQVPGPVATQWLALITDGSIGIKEATIDDLRKACEAVGLHVVDDTRVRQALDASPGESTSDAATRLHNEWVDTLERAEKAEGLAASRLDHVATLTAEVATLRAQLDELRAEHRSMVAASLRELEVLRAQLAAAEALLEATRQASQCAPKSADIPKMVADIVANRKAVCEHARALEAQLAAITSSEGRATDGDLEAMADEGYRLRSGWNVTLGDMRKLARDVAARVRRERGECLVERLVDGKVAFNAFEREPDATWTVHVCLPGTGGYTTNVTDLPAADVPATLARLAGLDGGR